MDNENPTPIALDWASSDVRRILGGLLDGGELSVDDGIRLTETHGRDLQALTLVADEMRHRQAGDVVTYVVNRNINFTNVCIKHCTFCAFSRDHREEEGYFSRWTRWSAAPSRRGRWARPRSASRPACPRSSTGATTSISAARSRRRCPRCNCTPSRRREILYGSTRSGLPIPEYLAELKKAGLGTLPGTSAEVLDQDIRDLIARGRITVEQWIEVITSAHAQGIRTTSTIMYGHVEQPTHWIRHMDLLRRIQKDTGGFTEFVPLSLIHQEAPMYRRGLVPGRASGRDRARGRQDARARPALPGAALPQHPVLVGEGRPEARPDSCSPRGANDMGGTLINESISTSAGASYGQLVPPAELRRLIRDAGRLPAQRSTTYDLPPRLRGGGRRGRLPARPRRERGGPLRLLPDAGLVR